MFSLPFLLALAKSLQELPDNANVSVSGIFDDSLGFPQTASRAHTSESSLPPSTSSVPKTGFPWFGIVLAVLITAVIGGTIAGLVCARKCKRGIRPTASGQIDEHAADPLLVPDEFF
jgi:hypothetical protein